MQKYQRMIGIGFIVVLIALMMATGIVIGSDLEDSSQTTTTGVCEYRDGYPGYPYPGEYCLNYLPSVVRDRWVGSLIDH